VPKDQDVSLLSSLDIDEVSLVDRGANQHARVELAKNHEDVEKASPTPSAVHADKPLVDEEEDEKDHEELSDEDVKLTKRLGRIFKGLFNEEETVEKFGRKPPNLYPPQQPLQQDPYGSPQQPQFPGQQPEGYGQVGAQEPMTHQHDPAPQPLYEDPQQYGGYEEQGQDPYGGYEQDPYGGQQDPYGGQQDPYGGAQDFGGPEGPPQGGPQGLPPQAPMGADPMGGPPGLEQEQDQGGLAPLPQEVVDYIRELEEQVQELAGGDTGGQSDQNPFGKSEEFVEMPEAISLEELAKNLENEEQRELIFKALDLVAEAEDRAAQAEEIAKAERDHRLVREYVEKARSYTNLPVTPEEFGPVLKSMYEALEEDQVALIEKALGQTNNDLGRYFSEVGKSATTTEPVAALDAKVEEIRKSDTSLSREQAFAKMLEEDPSLYDQYTKEA
jgi:hypothetical protein